MLFRSVGYVLQKNKLYELGRQINKREIALEHLKWENSLRAAQLANLQIPQRLAQRVKEQKLGLFPPQPGQWIVLLEPPAQEQTNRPSNLFVVGK